VLQSVTECCRVPQRVALCGMGTKRYTQARAVTYMAHPLQLHVRVSFCLCLSVFLSVCVSIQTHAHFVWVGLFPSQDECVREQVSNTI